MSRAFVKEQDEPAPDEFGERALSPHPNYVTASGLARLRQQLHDTEQALASLAMAADAVDTPARRFALQRQHRWLQARIGNALPAKAPEQTDRVAFGAVVELSDVLSGAHYRYRIVGEDEAQPDQGCVSWLSPLAQALLGAQVGDIVSWARPAGALDIEVLTIRYPD